MQGGLVEKFVCYRHLSRKKSPLKRLFGAERAHAESGGILAERR
jgi:hypothetical protein